ncbi:MAG: radical SAM family heme chaperone HemW [Phycisphaerales bacterium JB054]
MTTRLPQIPSTSTAAVVQALAADPAHAPVRHLYIHVPFCFHKCHYCDFYSLVDTRDRQQPFTDRLRRELDALAPLARGEPLRSIFVGGGTPTLLRPDLWQQLLDTLDSAFDLSAVRAGTAEFSVECNPETATPELFDTLRAGGVNRLSMGAQSFDPKHLKTLERWHDPASVERAVGLARDAGISRTSIDLIFAIPGQTLPEWEADLDRAFALGTTHLSCYALTYEPNTAMTARLKRGDFAPTDEDLEADMYERTVERCAAAGLGRYEVSNFAAPGHECAHNLAYWRQASWLAAGPSASSNLRTASPEPEQPDVHLPQPGAGAFQPPQSGAGAFQPPQSGAEAFQPPSPGERTFQPPVPGRTAFQPAGTAERTFRPSNTNTPPPASWRWKNQPRLDDYLNRDDHGHPHAVDIEHPDATRFLGETLMTGVRLREGLDLERVLRSFDETTAAAVRDVAAAQIDRGTLLQDGNRIRPTDSGFLVADGIAREFLGVLW